MRFLNTLSGLIYETTNEMLIAQYMDSERFVVVEEVAEVEQKADEKPKAKPATRKRSAKKEG